jgi:hypothetical protein
LSTGCKEFLLKAIIQSIPIFSRGDFKIPKQLCQEFNGAMANFLWEDTVEKKENA